MPTRVNGRKVPVRNGAAYPECTTVLVGAGQIGWRFLSYRSAGSPSTHPPSGAMRAVRSGQNRSKSGQAAASAHSLGQPESDLAGGSKLLQPTQSHCAAKLWSQANPAHLLHALVAQRLSTHLVRERSRVQVSSRASKNHRQVKRHQTCHPTGSQAGFLLQ